MNNVDHSKETLIEDNMGLARAIAVQIWRTAPYVLDVEEMKALANLGLVDAANRWEHYCLKNGYDPRAVEYFRVFASRRINGTVRDAIRANDWATRTLRDKSKKLKLAGQDDGATVEELSERTGLSVKEVQNTIYRMTVKPISLSEGYVGEEHLQTSRHCDPIDVESIVFQNDLLETAVATIKSLPLDQQTVLALHYFASFEIRAVSKELNITESRASQLHTKAVLTVRQALMHAAVEKEKI